MTTKSNNDNNASNPKTPHNPYKYLVDKDSFESNSRFISGLEILQNANKPQENWCLIQKLKGGARQEIKPTDSVDLGQPGRERFETIPKQVQNGESDTKSISLFPEDIEYLDTSFPGWKFLSSSEHPGILIPKLPIPEGLLPKETRAFVLVPKTYLTGACLDMIFLEADIAQQSKLVIPAITSRRLNGENWFQWSRHRTPAQKWRPGIDGIPTHLELMKKAIQTEVPNQNG